MPLFWKEPGLSLPAQFFYRTCRAAVDLLATFLYRFRVFGAEHIPPPPRAGERGVLVIANHASHLDPPLIGAALRGRAMRSLARSGLFRHPLFSRLIDALGAIPIRENEGDMQAMRKAIAELEQGRLVLIFPEGTRSPDGRMRAFKRGCWLLIQRAKCDVLPAAVVGAHDIWPRGRGAPRLTPGPLGSCAVMFGPVICFDDLSAASRNMRDADKGLELLESRVADLHTQLESRLAAHSRKSAWGL